MFDKLKVPTIALVENMAYYKCGSCDAKHRIFGDGHTDSIMNSYGIANSIEVPIQEEIAHMGDSGTPFVLTLPDTVEIVQKYNELAYKVKEEVDGLEDQQVEVRYEYGSGGGRVLCDFQDGSRKVIDPFELRVRCECALCVDETTGRRKL